MARGEGPLVLRPRVCRWGTAGQEAQPPRRCAQGPSASGQGGVEWRTVSRTGAGKKVAGVAHRGVTWVCRARVGEQMGGSVGKEEEVSVGGEGEGGGGGVENGSLAAGGGTGSALGGSGEDLEEEEEEEEEWEEGSGSLSARESGSGSEGERGGEGESRFRVTLRMVETSMLAATAGVAYFLANNLRIEVRPPSHPHTVQHISTVPYSTV